MQTTKQHYTEMTPNGFGITIEIDDILYSKTSEFQKVEILSSRAFGKILTLDGLMMTTEKDEFFYHEMITHIPMLAHKNPENVLVIGGGDGGTIREVLKHSCVKSAELCEIDALVIEASRLFLPSIAGMLDDSKVKIFVEDAIEFIKDKKSCYDVILIDSTDPMGPGEGLFTEEFYTNVYNALKPDGIMAAQSESPFANQAEIKKIYPLLKKVFPLARPYCGPVPTYPAGFWSWAFCPKTPESLDYVDKTRQSEIVKTSKLYTEELHQGAFAVVPKFMKDLICS